MSVDLYRRYLNITRQIAGIHGREDSERVAQLLAEREDLQEKIGRSVESPRGHLVEIGEILAEVARLDAGITEAMRVRRGGLRDQLQKTAGTSPVPPHRARLAVALDRRA